MNLTSLPQHAARKKQWKVVYTRSNYEKKAHQLLSQQGLHSFCPVITIKSKWADRYKLIEKPLFPSYLFVYVSAIEEHQVLATTGILSYINFCGKPAVMPDEDISRINEILSNYNGIETINSKRLSVGDKVLINQGFKAGSQAEILEVEEKTVLLVLNQLDCALVAKIRVDIGNIIADQSKTISSKR
ncbi:UpxY family transcription antiterminator [Pedobacter petrophilus]|uniref:UpxY family transcription antiterminator n=1 Tax=Pedobacter petrophilus TaxID=1908241 RepID=A0A7K0G508_9SPHI|nr:UpxY family transcription antiterminator [Pedobacter petrophilus]MRX78329.1 UpxY family transcription antiterminator [Pedobacter petrophilus]